MNWLPFSIGWSLIKVLMIGLLWKKIEILNLIQDQHSGSNFHFVVKEDLLSHAVMITLAIVKITFYNWTWIKYHQLFKISNMKFHRLFLKI